MASIRKTPNGNFEATVYLGRDANGTQIRRSFTHEKESEVKSWARQLEQDYADNKMLSVSTMKFEVWAAKWLEIKKTEVRGNTYLSRKAYVKNHFVPFFKKFKLDQINEQHVRVFLAELKSVKNLSNETIRKIFFSLHELLDMALKHRNPMKDLKPPKPKRYIPIVPNDKEFEMLLNVVKGMFDEVIILFGGLCGMREGEIFALKWGDIDFKNRRINIDETRGITEDGYTNTDPKSEKSNRNIAVHEIIIDLLKPLKPEYKSENGVYNLKDKQKFDDELNKKLIFDMRPDSYSKRFAAIIDNHNEMYELLKENRSLEEYLKFHRPDSIKKQIKIQSNPLPDITFHSLRHYHATTLYRKGFADQYIADRCGHDVMVQKKVYQHILQDHRNELDNLVVNIKPGD